MDRHLTTECPILLPSGLAKPKAKPLNTCAATKCRTKLIVPIQCSTCKLNYCAPHRFQKDHACSGLAAAPSKSTTSSSLPASIRSAPTVNSGLAAIRRVREKATKAIAKENAKASSSSSSSTTLQQPVVIEIHDTDSENDSDIEFVSSTTKLPSKTASLAGSATAPSKSKVGVPFVATKVDKRIKAERASAMKALEVRMQKGLLTEQEKVDYAT